MCSDASDLEIAILTVRESDDILHVFIGGNKDRGHITMRGGDCPCEPEISMVSVKGEIVRLMMHDNKVPTCQ